MLQLELNQGVQGTPTTRGMRRHPPEVPDGDPLQPALHQGREGKHLPVHPGQEGHLETHHLQGKGPWQ
jgi:hypothetical protein